MHKKRVNHHELMALGIVQWTSWKTTERKIKNDGFPAYFDGGRWSFDPKEVEGWIKARKHRAS